MIELDVLGPLELRYRGQAVHLQPKQRLVILALLCAETTLSADRLVELIWDRPTAGSGKTLRTHISRARKAVAAAGGGADDLIVTTDLGGGHTVYRLADGLGVDAVRFQEQVNAGCQAFRRDLIEEAACMLSAALKLWRRPLAEAASRPFALGYVGRLENTYRTAVLTQLKAGISLGLHREAVGELNLLTRRWPGEGEAWVLLITALYRSNRMTEASRACRLAIDTMREVGLDERLFLDLQHGVLNGSLPRTGLLVA